MNQQSPKLAAGKQVQFNCPKCKAPLRQPMAEAKKQMEAIGGLVFVCMKCGNVWHFEPKAVKK